MLSFACWFVLEAALVFGGSILSQANMTVPPDLWVNHELLSIITQTRHHLAWRVEHRLSAAIVCLLHNCAAPYAWLFHEQNHTIAQHTVRAPQPTSLSRMVLTQVLDASNSG